MPPENFGGLSEEHAAYETARAVIFPVPLERTTSYRRGTYKAPDAVLAASRQMELFDDELELEIFRETGIATLPPIDTMDGTFEEVTTELFTAELALLDDQKLPVAIGGEHSLTPPLVLAMSKKYKNLSVLHIGATAKLRDEYQGSPASLRCAMRRVVEICPTVQVGIRSISTGEAEALPKLKTKIYWAKHIVHAPLKGWIAKVLDDLSPNVYLTVNMDGFDPSVVPSSLNPEPGGLEWLHVMSLIRALANHKKIVGMDVVELFPQAHDQASNLLAARLIYKTLGYIFCEK